MTISVLYLFFGGPRVGLQCVIVAFTDNTQLLFILIVMRIVSVTLNKRIENYVCFHLV